MGVAVNRQKQHVDKEVAKLASEIVSKWRDDVNKLKPALKKGASSPKTAHRDASKPSANGGTSPTKITVPPEQRNWKKDGVDVKRTGNTTRDNCLGLLYDGLAFCSEECTSLRCCLQGD